MIMPVLAAVSQATLLQSMKWNCKECRRNESSATRYDYGQTCQGPVRGMHQARRPRPDRRSCPVNQRKELEVTRKEADLQRSRCITPLNGSTTQKIITQTPIHGTHRVSLVNGLGCEKESLGGCHLGTARSAKEVDGVGEEKAIAAQATQEVQETNQTQNEKLTKTEAKI